MRIGIIGGGIAGLATAWLLEKQHDVFLFESRSRLGGHAATHTFELNGETVSIELGFEFFNESMFPHLFKLLSILEVPIKAYPLTYSFYTNNRDDCYLLPPFREGRIPWEMLNFSKIGNLIQFAYALQKAKSVINKKLVSVTLERFADSLWLTPLFKETFFYPFLAAGWGVSIDEFKQFSAYDVLTWVVKNKPHGFKPTTWYEITHGMSSYIAKLAAQLSKTQINLSSAVTSILSTEQGYHIAQADGRSMFVDQLIIATNAYQVRNLLNGIPEITRLREALSSIEYFRTTIAVHGDTRWMPQDRTAWSIANVCYDDTISALTIYKSWRSSIPVFRSWLMLDQCDSKLPEPLYALEHFYHAKVTPYYFEAQKQICQLQGQHNIWLAGIYTSGIDSHESAIASAINIAKKLNPQGERLTQLISF